ncbi:MAG: SufD family Fe-S cluster assembly protein [Candidatus Magasanikbacteria bacterium]|nr:SufD family Fe-S cluster assembly protein [Candidatus Magasanikbacteria bacterium]
MNCITQNTEVETSSVSSEGLLNYGLGISTDLRFLNFANRTFETGAVRLSAEGGDLYTPGQKPDLWSYRLGIKEPLSLNPYFKENADKPTDSYIIRQSVNGELVLDFEQIKASAMCYVLLIVEPGLDLRIVEKNSVKDYSGLILDLILGDNSRLEYSVLQNTSEQSTSMTLRMFSVGDQADLRLIDMQTGGKLSLTNNWIRLAGFCSRGEIHSGFFGNKSQQFDVYNVVEHAAPSTVSRMLGKGALDDSAQAIYRGLIRIHPGSENADGSQKEDTLLLSSKARISSVPDLEIAHHKVKCSHAVSTSRIDKEKLFFMNARGIETPEAISALVEGHFSPVVDHCLNAELRQNIEKSIKEKLKRWQAR